MDNVFTHSGDLGDIIYALPTIKALGGGVLHLTDTPGKTAHGMTQLKAFRLGQLLEKQEYIREVCWTPTGAPKTNLDGFRDHSSQQNLADRHLSTYGLPWQSRMDAWLDCPKQDHDYPILMQKSVRYPGNLPWGEMIDHYVRRSVRMGFVGFPEEYEAFCNQYPSGSKVEYIQLDNFLQLACWIKGCQWFVGNQSSPLAVAHGLKHNVMIDVCYTSRSDCHFQREGEIMVWGGRVEWPIIKS